MEPDDNSFEADQRRFRIRLGIFFVGVVLLGLTAWFGRVPYRHFVARNAGTQAQEFFAKGDYRNAVLCARRALAVQPTNVAACRVMATMADLSHSPVALDYQQRVALAEPTAENKMALAALALRYQRPPFPLAAQIINDLAATATNLPNYHVLAASLALSLNRMAVAENEFATAARLEPTNRLFELNLAVLRLAETNETKSAAARATLDKFSADPRLAPQSLRSLISDRLAHQDLAAAGDYSARLLASPQATIADRLRQLEILLQQRSATFPARLVAAQELCVTNAPAAAQVAGWMQSHGLLAESVQWITNLPPTVQTQPPVRVVLSDAFLASSNWPALRQFAGEGNWDDLEFFRLAVLSRMWSEMDLKRMADGNWSAAISEAGYRLGALITLLDLADKWQMPDRQEMLLERIVEKFPQEGWAVQALTEHYVNAGKTGELHALYAKLFSLFPKNDLFKNNLAATALLLKTNLPQACELAAEVYASRTNDPNAVSTYAFALHLQGRTKDGLAALEKLDPRSLKRPDVALYYGILLSAASRSNEAAPYLDIAQTQGHPLPEERQLLKK